MVCLKIKKLYENTQLPTKANPSDACFDIYADILDDNGKQTDDWWVDFVKIPPHRTVLIKTGFATEIPKGYWAPIFARSGLSTKKCLRPVQGVAVIDSGYRGEWLIPLHNDSEEVQIVKHGDRIAQFMLAEVLPVQMIEVDNLSESDRGEGAFGSSGV